MSTPQTAPPARPTSSGDRRRKRLASYTVRNMVLSVLPVAALALLWWSITYNPQEQQTRPAQVAPVAAHVAQEAEWPVWVPEPGEGWTPTVAWYDTLEDVPTWHLSFMSPDGEYAALHQASEVTDPWLQAVLDSGEEAGEVELTGPGGERVWTRYEGPRPGNAEQAWLLGPDDTGGSTVVVSSTAALGEDELTDFLESVQTRD